MKKVIFCFVLCVALTVSLATVALALESNEGVRTKVGNPNTNATGCPIPIDQSIITCGSKNEPRSSCGHCGLNYGDSEWCTGPKAYTSINYAMDVQYPGQDAGNRGKPIYFPTIKGNTISWTHAGVISGDNQEIQKYNGTDTKTGEQYYIQFHHTTIGSGTKGTHDSGEIAATICEKCNHVHIEFGSSGPSGTSWLDAPLYFCQK